MLILEDMARWRVHLREATSAGEPLNPEVIDRVRAAWGLTIRDGYGQTETSCQIGNSPGQAVKPGSMGRPMPGFDVALGDTAGGQDGEITLACRANQPGLMAGYLGDAELDAHARRHGRYHTGDVARRDDDGYIVYVGRADDLFKSSDYRISPFELESVLIAHPAVAEAAVVPSPDPVRGTVPKAFLRLRPAHEPSRDLARDIFAFVRRLEFSSLPMTISGKIRRVELREQEARLQAAGERLAAEYRLDDFPDLRH